MTINGMHYIFTWRDACRDALVTLVFNTVLAVILTLVLPINDGLRINLVYSHCIGLLSFALVDLGRWLMARFGVISFPRMAVWLMIAIPLGFLGGWTIAAYLMGHANGMVRLGEQMFWAVNAIVVPAVVLLTVMAFKRERHIVREAERQMRISAVERESARAQLALLQAQIEPHFLFNTLANVQALLDADTATAGRMLGALSDYLRSSFQVSRSASTTLQHEFDLIKAYLDILKMRMGARLEFTLDLPAELAATPLVPMLLQPLVENAIEHGLAPLPQGGCLTVGAQLQDGQLQLLVTDNGQGLNPQAKPKNGLGLANVRERLALSYNGAAQLVLEDQLPQGTRASLILPLAVPIDTPLADTMNTLQAMRQMRRFGGPFCPMGKTQEMGEHRSHFRRHHQGGWWCQRKSASRADNTSGNLSDHQQENNQSFNI